MKTKKNAVQPIAPTIIENSMIPATWQEAFNMLADKVMRVTRHQHTRIGELTTALENARGVAAAADKHRGELAVEVAGLSAALDVQDKAVKAIADNLANTVARIEDVAGELVTAVKGHTDTTAALAALGDAVGALKPLADQHAELAAIVGADGGGMVKRLDGITDRVEAIATHTERVEQDAGVLAGRLDKAEAVAGEIGRQGIATTARVDDMRVSLEAVAALVEDYAKTASSEDAALTQSLDEVADAVQAVEKRVMELQNVAGEHSVAISDAGAAIKATGTTLDLFGERLTDAVGVVDTLTKARAHDGERLRVVEDNVAETRTLVGAVSREMSDESSRIQRIEQAVEGFVATTVNIGRDVAGAVAAVERCDQVVAAHAEQISDAIRRVTISLGEMPAGFMIDQNGILNRVNRAGDLTPIGKVVGEAKDGRDAPVIVAAKIENDRLIITLSDRTEITAVIPRAVEPIAPAAVEPLDPTTLGYLSKDPTVRAAQVANMIDMRAEGKKYKEIAVKYDISERTAARMINEWKAK